MKVESQNLSLAVKGLETLDGRILAAASVGLHRGLLGAVGVVQREFLRGPRPGRLGERSTRLRSSITARVEADYGRVRGAVGTNVVYAARHEFGFRGVENVRAHTRVVKQIDKLGGVIDTRRVLRDRNKKLIGFKDSRKDAAGDRRTGMVFVQFVKAHRRKVNYKGRPFARPGVLKSMPMILREVQRELAAMAVS